MKSNAKYTLSALVTLTLLTHTIEADLVAYWPMNEGVAGTEVVVADDIIDAGLTFTDAIPNNDQAMWVNDATRGIVLSTVEGNRLSAGTQGIDLNDGFTWSLCGVVALS